MNLQEFYVKQREASRVRTRQVMDLLREDHMTWRPVPGALSVGEMLRHMWVSEDGVRRVALDGNFAYYEKRIPEGLNAVIGTPGTLEKEIAQIERVHEGLGFRRKIAVILFGISDHEVHHRAQLMTYLRMLGRPAPEPFAKK
jgi:hypothetical protein